MPPLFVTTDDGSYGFGLATPVLYTACVFSPGLKFGNTQNGFFPITNISSEIVLIY